MDDLRGPPEDLRSALKYNPQSFHIHEIAHVAAEVPGENDEYTWYWVVRLASGAWYLIQANCDYTGWDCQSYAESMEAPSPEAAATLAPETEGYTDRAIRSQLLAQLVGTQPYGTYETIREQSTERSS